MMDNCIQWGTGGEIGCVQTGVTLSKSKRRCRCRDIVLSTLVICLGVRAVCGEPTDWTRCQNENQTALFGDYGAPTVLGETLLQKSPFTYRLVNGNAIITDYTGTSTDVVFPAEIDGYPVTEIDEGVFYYGTYPFVNVTISEGIRKIGHAAFGYSDELETFSIPSTLITLGDSNGIEFRACSKLRRIDVAEGNPYYKSVDGVLYDKSGTTLIYCPASKNPNGAFVVPSTVTYVAHEAFNCSKFKTVTLPEAITEIEEDVFDCAHYLTTMVVPPRVSSIGRWAFAYCYALTSVTIPSSVTSIGDYAFADCSSLASVYFDGNAPACGTDAFDGVASDAKVYVRRDSTGWNVRIPGRWKGFDIDYYPTYTVVFSANGGSSDHVHMVELGSNATRPADPTKDGHVFNGWFVDADCTASYDFNAPVTADITLYAKWTVVRNADGPTDPIGPDPIVPTEPAPVLYTNPATTPFEGNANYNGWVRDTDGKFAGMLVIKSAKAAKPEKGGQSKLMVQYTPFKGSKQSIKLDKANYPVVGGNPTVNIPGVGLVTFGGTSLAGVGLQMGKDLAKSKDKAEKAAANARLARMDGTWTFAFGTTQGYAALSVTVKKGKGKLTGTLPDGTMLSVSSVGILGDTALAIPFGYAKKGSLGFVFWMNDNGTVAVSDMTALETAWGETLAVTELIGPSVNHRLADGANRVFDAGKFAQTFTASGKKWTFPKHVAKSTAEKLDRNPHSVKLTYTEKTGLVKGTFVGSTTMGKSVKYMVNGVVVDGVMYGSSFVKGWGAMAPVTAK